jgi:vacuolar-type H+-ATPase subunit I/STV1
MQSVPITTDVVSSNLDQGEVYNIMWSSLSVTCGRSVVFLGTLVSSTNNTDRHDIAQNIVESGIKHH